MNKQLIIRICDKTIEWSFYALLVVVAFSNSLVEIAAITMITAWAIKKLLDRDFKPLVMLPVGIMLVFWLWAGLSCFNSGYFSESFRGMFKVFKNGMLFVIAASELKGDAVVKRFLGVLSAGAVVISANGVYQYFTGLDLIRHHQLQPGEAMRRITSSFVHPNDCGAYFMVVSIILISCVVSRSLRVKERAGVLAALMFSGLALFLTKSRGAFISFAAALVTLGALISRKFLVFFIALLIVGTALLPGGVRHRVLSAGDIREGSTWERVQLWKGTVDMIKVHPLLGFGVNTYSRNFPLYKPADYQDLRYAHNCYLHMASEIGIPGALIFMVFLLSVFVISAKKMSRMTHGLRRDIAGGLVAALVGFALNSAVDTHLYSVTLSAFFFVLLGYCLALVEHE